MQSATCKYCNATGNDPNTNLLLGYRTCPVCEGKKKRVFDDSKYELSTCEKCNGRGIDRNSSLLFGYQPCPDCEGWGWGLTRRATRNETINELPIYRDETSKKYSNKVFIVHGHDDLAKKQLADILTELGFTPIILHEQPNRGRTIIEKFEQETSDVGYAFVIMTPDDLGVEKRVYEESQHGNKHCEFCSRSRQNVVLELGFFYGKLGRHRVCCLVKGKIEKPSDFEGILYLPFNNTVDEVYTNIVKELKALKLPLRTNK